SLLCSPSPAPRNRLSVPIRRSSDLPSACSPSSRDSSNASTSAGPRSTSTPRSSPSPPATSSASPSRPSSSPASSASTPTSGSKRSEEHTSELQSRENLVCRLLLEQK